MPCIHWHARPWWKKFTPMPEDNGIILYPRRLDDDGRIAYFHELDAFLASTKGFYVADTYWPPGKESFKLHELGSHYKFTDPNTAFAFKLQFYRGELCS